MNERPYPNGIDCVWLASDNEGRLAAFITAGEGPIPAEALKFDRLPVEDIEGLIGDMPRVSEACLLVVVKRPDDFITFAERGLFVYDWTDVHRTTRQAVHAYEAVATPTKPISLGMLPADLAGEARALQFIDVSFADAKRLDVCAYMHCSVGA